MSGEDKRQQILQAAEHLFTNRRFHEISLDEVAQAARVGKGTIYQYFGDKDDLFFQVATSGSDELCALLASKVPEDAPFAQQLLDACLEITAFFDRRRQLFRMMQSEDARLSLDHGKVHDRWMAKRTQLREAVAGILRKGLAEGSLRDDIPPELLAHFLLGMLRTRARDLAHAPKEMQRHELVIDLFLRGAGRPSPTRQRQ